MNEKVRERLISISPATIDRLLRPWRPNHQHSGISMTRLGKLLKNQIPVRTFADWEESLPVFLKPMEPAIRYAPDLPGFGFLKGFLSVGREFLSS